MRLIPLSFTLLLCACTADALPGLDTDTDLGGRLPGDGGGGGIVDLAGVRDLAVPRDFAVLRDLAIPRDFAAPPPGCSLRISPQTGFSTDVFVTTLVSVNATACTFRIDNGGALPIPCNATQMSTGAQLGGVGTHTGVVEAAGPGGRTTCSAVWTVRAPTPPTCQLTVMPARGRLNDTFNFSLVSTNATACSVRVDGSNPVQVPCNINLPGNGQNLGGVGRHTGVVTATGPGGATTCSASWEVIP